MEVKQVDLPQDMQRAIARQAEAERERRAKIINADGEYQASEKLSEAAHILATEPITITLRYLQTLAEIGTEKNTTIVFPIPVELLSALMGKFSPLLPRAPRPACAEVAGRTACFLPLGGGCPLSARAGCLKRAADQTASLVVSPTGSAACRYEWRMANCRQFFICHLLFAI